MARRTGQDLRRPDPTRGSGGGDPLGCHRRGGPSVRQGSSARGQPDRRDRRLPRTLLGHAQCRRFRWHGCGRRQPLGAV